MGAANVMILGFVITHLGALNITDSALLVKVKYCDCVEYLLIVNI